MISQRSTTNKEEEEEEAEGVMSTPPISDGYQYYDNFHNNEATTAVASALQFLESGKTNDSNNNDSNDDVETPLAKLMNRGEYYRQLRKLVQEDERMRIKDHESSSSSHFCCCCSYDVDSWEEKKDDDCCNNCHNNNNHDNNDYGDTIVGGGQDIIHRNSDNTTTTLMYESYLKHQRYYDDLKHADINFINYGTKFASFLLTGDVHSSSKQRIQGRKDLIIEQRKYLGKGGLCWDAAFILGEHVIHNVSEWRINNNTVEVVREGNRTTRVVELGAGTGLCGLMIAAAAFDDVIVEITDLLELQDLMCANINRNFGGNSCSNSDDDDGDDTKKEEEDGDDESRKNENFNTTNSNVSCRVLQWGVTSNYINAPYDVIMGADVVTSIYDPIALAQTFYALSGPHTKIYISGKTRLDKPHEIFEMEMKRLFVSVRKIDVPNSRLRSPNVFVLVVQGKQELL
jgi:hypothetical protein